MNAIISREKFLQTIGLLGASSILSPIIAKSEKLFFQNRRIKIGVIGCGSVSNMYLPHLEKCEYVELVSTCDIIFERAKSQAEKFNISNYYPNIYEMLKGVNFDLLVNLTDMQEHGKLNEIALNAGKHVWSEKPMHNSYAEGKSLLDLAKSKGLKIWGAPAVVNSPQFAYMSKSIREGKLGKVSAAHAHYGHTGPTWSAFFYEKGGGSLPDLGVYNLATLTGLLGPAKSVIAMTSIVTKERIVDNKGKINVEAEDNAIVVMDHGNGVLSSVQCGFNYFDPFGHSGEGQDRPTITIWGTNGNMALIGYDWSPFGVHISNSWEKPEGERFETDPKNYVWQQGASVIAESLVTGIEPLIAAEHALHVLEIIEAARKSGENGERILLSSTFKYPVI